MTNQIDGSALAANLSDEAIELSFGWFSRGSNSTVNSSAPHANKTANQAALDELEAAGFIVHTYDERRDIHTFVGTPEAAAIGRSDRGRNLIMARLGLGDGDTSGSEAA